MKTILFLLLLSLSSAHAQEVSVTADQLRAVDASLDEQLKHAHFTGNVEDVQFRVNPGELPSFKLSSLQSSAMNESPETAAKNLWVAGIVMSSVYLKGLNLSYLHFDPEKQKVIYHVEASVSGSPEMSNLTLSFAPHVGHKGFYAGLNGQLLRYQNQKINDMPAIYTPGGGVMAGWQHSWGGQGKWVSNLSVGSSVAYYQSYVYFVPEFRGSIGFRFLKH